MNSSIVPFNVDFPENNTRLTFDNTASGDSSTLSCMLDGIVPVLCIEVKAPSELQLGARVTRLVKIYRRLSIGTLVQKFYGVLKKSDKLYYVEDLKTAPTLASVLVSEDRPSFSSRLKMAHDLANTVAYFHATGLPCQSPQ
jgi:hypothetical protein